MASRSATFSANDYESAVAVVEGMIERLPEYLIKQQQENLTPQESNPEIG
jgi:hypothetical protein